MLYINIQVHNLYFFVMRIVGFKLKTVQFRD